LRGDQYGHNGYLQNVGSGLAATGATLGAGMLGGPLAGRAVGAISTGLVDHTGLRGMFRNFLGGHHRGGNAIPDAGPYGGSFFDGGQGLTGGMNPFDGSNYNSQYGPNSGSFNQFGTGYGAGNMLASNPYNVDAFGRPVSTSDAVGSGGVAGEQQGAPAGNNGQTFNWLMGGGRSGWGSGGHGSSGGPNYK
jgi:hypothetical protein